eukprot:363798-Chlamydomonas_euryale.AAC.4
MRPGVLLADDVAQGVRRGGSARSDFARAFVGVFVQLEQLSTHQPSDQRRGRLIHNFRQRQQGTEQEGSFAAAAHGMASLMGKFMLLLHACMH